MTLTATRCRTGQIRRRRRVHLVAISLLSVAGLAGCLIDDSGAGPGPRGPTASVPDAGGPARRESAAKTLNDAEPDRPPAEGTLDVPPPPVQKTQ